MSNQKNILKKELITEKEEVKEALDAVTEAATQERLDLSLLLIKYDNNVNPIEISSKDDDFIYGINSVRDPDEFTDHILEEERVEETVRNFNHVQAIISEDLGNAFTKDFHIQSGESQNE